MIDIYKYISTISKDRLSYLHNLSKELAKDIDVKTSNNSLNVFETLYVISLAILAFINSLGKLGIESFSEIFNQMTLISQHKQNKKK